MCSLFCTPHQGQADDGQPAHNAGAGTTLTAESIVSLIKEAHVGSVYTVSVCSTVFHGLLECTAVRLKGGSGCLVSKGPEINEQRPSCSGFFCQQQKVWRVNVYGKAVHTHCVTVATGACELQF